MRTSPPHTSPPRPPPSIPLLPPSSVSFSSFLLVPSPSSLLTPPPLPLLLPPGAHFRQRLEVFRDLRQERRGGGAGSGDHDHSLVRPFFTGPARRACAKGHRTGGGYGLQVQKRMTNTARDVHVRKLELSVKNAVPSTECAVWWIHTLQTHVQVDACTYKPSLTAYKHAPTNCFLPPTALRLQLLPSSPSTWRLTGIGSATTISSHLWTQCSRGMAASR